MKVKINSKFISSEYKSNYIYLLKIWIDTVYPVYPENSLLIVPIPKSGNKNLVTNYRPISLLPVLSIICEKTNRLLNFTLPYFHPVQHGFLPGSSCLTNLSILQSCVISCLLRQQSVVNKKPTHHYCNLVIYKVYNFASAVCR